MNNMQNILIVDDKPENLYALQQVLDPLQARIVRAGSGNEALIATLNHEFAVAILDVQMPEMDGYELAEWLHGQEKTRNLPIIFVSAVYSDEDHEFRGYRSGAVDYIVKPYNPNILLGKVAVFLELDRQRQESRHMARQLQEVNEELESRVQRRTESLEKMNHTLRVSEQKLRYLSARLLSVQEEERRRIAAELHDSVGSSLSAIKFSMEGLHNRSDLPSEAADAIPPLIRLAGQTIEDVRRIMNNLRPPFFDDYGLIAAVEELMKRCGNIYDPIRIRSEIFATEEGIPEQLKIVIFRVVQEAFNNLAKYSRADEARLFIQIRDDRLELRVTDNGVGFDPRERKCRSGGMGLTTMKERVELSGGHFSFASAPGQGMDIQAQWDLRRVLNLELQDDALPAGNRNAN